MTSFDAGIAARDERIVMTERRPSGNERLAILETKLDGIADSVSNILYNHLPHLEKNLKTLTFWLIGLLTTANLALLGLLLKK